MRSQPAQCDLSKNALKPTNFQLVRPLDFFQEHAGNLSGCFYKSKDLFWFTSDAFLKRHVLSFQDSYVKLLPGGLQAKVVPERITYRVTWRVLQRVPLSISASRLRSDASSWENNLRNPKDQDDHKKGTLSDQPRLTRVTPTALLACWVLQLIKGMMSLGTDFEMHAKWQGSIE